MAARKLSIFGAGTAFVTPRQDAAGNVIAVPTPVKVDTIQNIQLPGMKFDSKKMFGQNQFPVDVARGKADMSIGWENGRISAKAYNDMFFGQTLTSGMTKVMADEVGTVIPATPFAITPTVPESGTWAEDLGVIMNGNPMTKVATGATPTTGQYKCAAGVYTFAAADAASTAFISYSYTVTTGNAIVMSNQKMGAQPEVSVMIHTTYSGNQLNIKLLRCIPKDMSWATKQDDFCYPKFDLDVLVDEDTNQVGTWWFSK